MSTTYELETGRGACIRGCTQLGRHADESEDHPLDCRGCAPKPARHGLLCDHCHAMLADALHHVGFQVWWLRESTEPSRQPSMTVPTNPVHISPRTDDSQPHYIGVAKGVPSADAVEPIRLPALDAARELEDLVSQMVERLAEDYQIAAPEALRNAADDMRRKRWFPTFSDGTPRLEYERIVSHLDVRNGRVESGQYGWVDPPTQYEVRTGAAWLRGQLLRLEHQDGIGDDLESLSTAMAQGHALAPWRPQSWRLPGIPCPECKRMSLVLYGGMEDVVCESCNAVLPWARYAVWVAMYRKGEVKGVEGAVWTSEAHSTAS